MATRATNDDVEAIGRRHDRARPCLGRARWQLRPVVQRVDRVAGKRSNKPSCTIARAAASLLGGLKDEVHRPVEPPRACQSGALRPAALPYGRRARSRDARQGSGLCGRGRLCSAMGRASMSARKPTLRPPRPARRMPTTPVPPMPSCTSRPRSRSAEGDDARQCDAPGRRVRRVGMQVPPERHEVGNQVGDLLDGRRL